MFATFNQTGYIASVYMDSTSILGYTGLVYNNGSLTAYYKRQQDPSSTLLVLTGITTLGVYKEGGWRAVDNNNMQGLYEFHVPNAALSGTTPFAYVDFSFIFVNITPQAEGSLHIDINAPVNITSILGSGIVPNGSIDVNVSGMNSSIVNLIATGIVGPTVTGVWSAPYGPNNITGTFGAGPPSVQGNIFGSVSGGVTGSVQGNLLGNVVGNVQGNLIGFVSGNMVGNVLGTVATVNNLAASAIGVLSIANNAITSSKIAAGALTNNAVAVSYLNTIASGVWNLPRGASTVTGTFGEGVASVRGDIYGDVTGSVSGSVGSVLAGVTANVNVGSVVTGVWGAPWGGNNITGTFGYGILSVQGPIVGDLRGNITGHILGNVSGNVLGSVGSVGGDVLGNVDGNVQGNVQGSTAVVLSLAAGIVNPNTFTVGAIASGVLAASSIPLAAFGGAVVTGIAGSVWDVNLTDHSGVSSMGGPMQNNYLAQIKFTRDQANTTDEWTAAWYRNGIKITGSVPTLTVVNKDNGSTLFGPTSMSLTAGTTAYGLDQVGANRLTVGIGYIATVASTIDGSARSFDWVVSRDS